MANIASAKKAARQSEKRRALNASQRSQLRSAIKRVQAAIKAGDKVAARGILRDASKVIDTIASAPEWLHGDALREKPIFVVSIDDCDLSPERCL